jgi:hypothetical protein
MATIASGGRVESLRVPSGVFNVRNPHHRHIQSREANTEKEMRTLHFIGLAEQLLAKRIVMK